uniref:Uncharacterized protein n=1 Tax=Chrysotila carterae TaxID=13221 RepID=A0A7S4B2P7_CHRCT
MRGTSHHKAEADLVPMPMPMRAAFVAARLPLLAREFALQPVRPRRTISGRGIPGGMRLSDPVARVFVCSSHLSRQTCAMRGIEQTLCTPMQSGVLLGVMYEMVPRSCMKWFLETSSRTRAYLCPPTFSVQSQIVLQLCMK